MTDLPIHPAANLFPMMTEEQFQQLKADIQEHGQQEPAVTWKNQLVDGHDPVPGNRWLNRNPGNRMMYPTEMRLGTGNRISCELVLQREIS